MAEITIQHLDALREAYFSGVTTVRYADKEVRYRSLDEMARLLISLEELLGISNTPRLITPSFSKGLSS
jgi:hypothetical protein